MYGQPPGPLNEDLLEKAIGKNQRITGRPANLLKPEINSIRIQLGDQGKDDEAVLIHALFPQLAIEFFKAKNGKH